LMKNSNNDGFDQHDNAQAAVEQDSFLIVANTLSNHPSWQAYFAQQPTPPPADASPKVPMAYKLQTEIGGAVYRLRKCTVEPVLGIIKDILGFRQCSLRGLWAAAGEWCLVCLAFNLKRLHTLTMG